MDRYRTTYPKDDAPIIVGDSEFLGVDESLNRHRLELNESVPHPTGHPCLLGVRKVSPSLPCNSTENSAAWHPETLGYHKRTVALGIPTTAVDNIFVGEYSGTLLFPTRLTTFINLVGYVVLRGAKKQMRWVYAKSVIAVMAHQLINRALTFGKKIRDAVGLKGGALIAHTDGELAASSVIAAREPRPTFTFRLLGNLFPKESDLALGKNGHRLNRPLLEVTRFHPAVMGS